MSRHKDKLSAKTSWRGATLVYAIFLLNGPLSMYAQTHRLSSQAPPQPCWLDPQGAALRDPPALRSSNGVLHVNLTLRNSLSPDGFMRYCYIDDYGNRSPTLHLYPGDTLILTLRNQLSLSRHFSMSRSNSKSRRASTGRSPAHADPCAGRIMTATSTNLHFHGLMVPPLCHQDETLKTVIQPGDAPFEYRIKIAPDQPPGLYWYHPHSHGFSEEQVLGGASGAIIIDGLERINPGVAALPERLLVIRDQRITPPSPLENPDPSRPTKELSINSVPVLYPNYPPALIKMKPLQREFWRVLNASADTFLDLVVLFAKRPQTLAILALDGVPLHFGIEGSQDYLSPQVHAFLPPGSRAEFVLSAPPEGVEAQLLTRSVFRGAADDDGTPVKASNASSGRAGFDDVDPARPLATILATADETGPPSNRFSSGPSLQPGLPPLSGQRPIRTRTLYFSEKLTDPQNPQSPTLFFITEVGKPRIPFSPDSPPDVVVHQGDVEDWFVENRSLESHTFHIHQVHFLLVGARGGAYEEPVLRDTVNLPAWDGLSRTYPRIRVRMDFRDPSILGTFPFHCHILQHIDGGMMGTVRVDPAPEKSDTPQRE